MISEDVNIQNIKIKSETCRNYSRNVCLQINHRINKIRMFFSEGGSRQKGAKPQ